MKYTALFLSLSAFASSLQIKFNSSGYPTELSLPSGDSVIYSQNSDGGYVRHFKNIENITSINESILWPGSFLSPIRYPFVLSDIIERYDHLAADDNFEYDYQEFMQGYTENSFSSEDLPTDIHQDLMNIVNKIEHCSPQGHALLKSMLTQKLIRFSNNIPTVHAAVVPMFSTDQILLSSVWIEGMRTNKWNPLKFLERDPNRSAELDAQMRLSYFGDESVDLATLNFPSRDWKYAFALLHETGHLVQHTFSHAEKAVLAFSLPYIIYTNRLNAMAMYGAPHAEFVKEFDKIKNDFNAYKDSVESGATFFALDAIATCNTNL